MKPLRRQRQHSVNARAKIVRWRGAESENRSVGAQRIDLMRKDPSVAV